MKLVFIGVGKNHDASFTKIAPSCRQKKIEKSWKKTKRKEVGVKMNPSSL